MTHALCPKIAGCALVLMAATSPAWAGASTQAEREATRQLNLQASQAAQVAATRVMPQPRDASTPGAPPAAAPSAAIQSATIKTAAAAQTAAAAPVDAAATANPANANPAIDVPVTATAQAAPPAPATLSTISNPPAKIATANVLDGGGKTIGAVQKVEVTATGTPTRVTVALVGTKEKVVTLDAAAVRYDAARNEISTALSGEQLKAQL